MSDPTEVIAEWLRSEDIVNGATGTWKMEWNAGMAQSLLAALRAEGFALVRKDRHAWWCRPYDVVVTDRDGGIGFNPDHSCAVCDLVGHGCQWIWVPVPVSEGTEQ